MWLRPRERMLWNDVEAADSGNTISLNVELCPWSSLNDHFHSIVTHQLHALVA
jgi:hypothetical protein